MDAHFLVIKCCIDSILENKNIGLTSLQSKKANFYINYFYKGI